MEERDWKTSIMRGAGCKTMYACTRVRPFDCFPVCRFDLEAYYSLPCFSIWIGSPHRIFPSSSTRAKTPSRGIMQSPAL